jgi:RNA-directed DNA polymerase
MTRSRRSTRWARAPARPAGGRWTRTWQRRPARIGHPFLLSQLGTFPARELVAGWLTAGVVEDGRFTPTGEGTPQGGVISPALLNVVLHGMEDAAGVRYQRSGTDAAHTAAGSPVLVRYADDLVVLCHSRQQAEQAKARLAAWLAPRGLAFNEDKTRIVTLEEGFDFLGFTVRRYRGKLLIKPAKAAVRRIRERLRTEMRSLRGANAQAVIARLNPIVRGWSAYYRTVVSSQTFTALDHYLWKLTYKWAKHSHPNKPTRWIIRRYFGTFNKSRHDQWVFGDRDSGAYLHRFAWTKIVRHQMVRGTSSPDDPALAEYWAARRHRGIPRPIDAATLRLLQSQHGRCPGCGQLLLDADRPPQTPREWEQWLAAIRKAITKNAIATPAGSNPDEGRLRLLHAHCYRQYAGKREARQLQPATSPRGLPEPRRGETRMSGS